MAKKITCNILLLLLDAAKDYRERCHLRTIMALFARRFGSRHFSHSPHAGSFLSSDLPQQHQQNYPALTARKASPTNMAQTVVLIYIEELSVRFVKTVVCLHARNTFDK